MLKRRTRVCHYLGLCIIKRHQEMDIKSMLGMQKIVRKLEDMFRKR